MARRGADDAELELARGDPLDDRLRVEDAQRDVELRVRAWNSQSRCESTIPPGPVDAPISNVPSSSPVASSASSP